MNCTLCAGVIRTLFESELTVMLSIKNDEPRRFVRPFAPVFITAFGKCRLIPPELLSLSTFTTGPSSVSFSLNMIATFSSYIFTKKTPIYKSSSFGESFPAAELNSAHPKNKNTINAHSVRLIATLQTFV